MQLEAEFFIHLLSHNVNKRENISAPCLPLVENEVGMATRYMGIAYGIAFQAASVNEPPCAAGRLRGVLEHASGGPAHRLALAPLQQLYLVPRDRRIQA